MAIAASLNMCLWIALQCILDQIIFTGKFSERKMQQMVAFKKLDFPNVIVYTIIEIKVLETIIIEATIGAVEQRDICRD
jgi:hypothetical protein